MPFTSVTLGLVPHFDVSVHIVLDDFGKAGRAYRETDEEDTNLGSVVDGLLTGQLNNPVRVVAFNTSEGWSRDVSEDIAREVVRRLAGSGRPLAASSRQFVQTAEWPRPNNIEKKRRELARPPNKPRVPEIERFG